MAKITKISQAGIDLIKQFEGFKSKAYLCPAGVLTIGYGTIRYPDGQKVKAGDVCTEQSAQVYLTNDLHRFELDVDAMATDLLNQNQFDSLVSFAYNLGSGNLKGSTLLKKVNANPRDESIKAEFMKWVYADNKKLAGLVNRRNAEMNLYFSNL